MSSDSINSQDINIIVPDRNRLSRDDSLQLYIEFAKNGIDSGGTLTNNPMQPVIYNKVSDIFNSKQFETINMLDLGISDYTIYRVYKRLILFTIIILLVVLIVFLVFYYQDYQKKINVLNTQYDKLYLEITKK